jgi:hypothetical protein
LRLEGEEGPLLIEALCAVERSPSALEIVAPHAQTGKRQDKQRQERGDRSPLASVGPGHDRIAFRIRPSRLPALTLTYVRLRPAIGWIGVTGVTGGVSLHLAFLLILAARFADDAGHRAG